MARVAYGLQLVVQQAHFLGGLYVYRVLLAHLVVGMAGDKIEQADIIYQLVERELMLCIIIKVVKAEAVEVADQNILRQFSISEAGKIVFGLGVGAVQVSAPAFVFYEQFTLPEQVYIAGPASLAWHILFKRSHTAAGDIEDMKEPIPKRLGFGVFISFVLPRLAKGSRTCL